MTLFRSCISCHEILRIKRQQLDIRSMKVQDVQLKINALLSNCKLIASNEALFPADFGCRFMSLWFGVMRPECGADRLGYHRGDIYHSAGFHPNLRVLVLDFG